MTTESIQNEEMTRIERWEHVADTFGVPLTSGQLVELEALSDLEAARRFLPHLSVVEFDEVLWAVGDVSCHSCC